jgi:chromosome segregation ATPase
VAQSEERQRSASIIDNLKLRIESLSNEKREIDRKHIALTEEMKGMRHDHNNELRGLEDSLAERREECATLHQEAIERNSKVSRLEADCHKAGAEIDLLRTKVADIDGREARLQDDLHRVTKERDALLSTVQTKEKEARQEADRKREDFQELALRLTSLMARELGKSLSV